LLNNLILQLCESFTPAELRLWLFDYKEGLAHLDALHADNDDKQYAIDAFARFEAIMRERSVLFRQCNPPATRLVEYNRQAAQPLPCCLMIVDKEVANPPIGTIC